MRIGAPEVADSPDLPGRVRLTASVRYDSLPGEEKYWFEVPRAVAPGLSDSGHPWLVALLPLAATMSEPLEIAAGVDARLLTGARRILRIWSSWYPWLGATHIVADAEPDGADTGGSTGAFFSGGVDSSHTALGRPDGMPTPEETRIDDLVTVGGFDVPLGNGRAIAALERMASEAAERIGRASVPVRTNLRETAWNRADWGYLAHGCGLAAIGLALEHRYDTLLMAATGGYRDLHPWGSHPLTDPLFSTSATRFVHHGAWLTRTEKMQRLAHSELLATLRVCWESASEENCGDCPKCLRTMATLELLDALGRAPSFPADRVDPTRIRGIRCEHDWEARELADLRDLAAKRGRDDVANAAGAVLRRWEGRRLARRLLAPARRRVGALRRRASRLGAAISDRVKVPDWLREGMP